MSRGPDAHTRLIRTIEALSMLSGCPVRVIDSQLTPWSSATFTGARHLLALEGPVSWRLMGWVNALPETELTVQGHLVADVEVMTMTCTGGIFRADLEVLTVEER